MRRNSTGLKKTEILDELKKLGINASSELVSYLKEYKTYYEKRNFLFLHEQGYHQKREKRENPHSHKSA
jgi:hypothetical protein